MSETKPRIILRTFRSIMISSMAIEAVSFIVSLTDSIVAANRIGIAALSAISLFTPFFSIANFVSAVVNSGTIMNYSFMVGKFQKKRADEFFSLGVFTAVILGILLLLTSLLVKPFFISGLSLDPEMSSYLSKYYNVAVVFLLFAPLCCLLDNIVVTDGGEKLSVAANSLQIVANVILSFLLSKPFGVTGIACATVGCQLGFILFISSWFLSKKNTLHFVPYFSAADLFTIIRCGIVRASTFATQSLMLWIVNSFVNRHYDITAFNVWMIVQKIMGLSSIFLGLSISVQSIIGTLKAENNTKALRALIHRLTFDLTIVSVAFTFLIMCFPSAVLRIFGIQDGDVFQAGRTAVRIISISILITALMVMFFVYYYLINKQILALTVGLLKDLICPVIAVILAGFVWQGDPAALWTALAVSPLLAMCLCSAIVLIRYHRKLFPFLLSKERYDAIHIYSFEITAENAVSMGKTAQALLKERGAPQKTQNLVCISIEDLLNLILERGKISDKRLIAECTLIEEDPGIRVILRDDGKRFDLSAEDHDNYSFLKYTLDRVISLADHKNYIITSGFNRNELFFNDKPNDI